MRRHAIELGRPPSVLRLVLVTLGILAVVVAVGVASPMAASAHTAANSPASNYVSRITAIVPAPKTFTAHVIEAGSRIELRWLSGPNIVVLDYDANPYLRIGPSGVEENLESNAVYLNRNRLGSSPLPEGLHPDGPPKWHRVSSTPTARWHDHRIHWMLASLPPTVKGRTGSAHLVQKWDIALTQGTSSQGTTSYAISGDLRWVPGPSPFPLLLLALALASCIVAFALFRRRSTTGRSTTGRSTTGRSATERPTTNHHALGSAVVGGLLIALLVVDAVHLFGIAFGIHSGAGAAFGRVASVGFVSIIMWVVAVVAVMLLWRGRADALYLVTLCAAVITFVGGLSDLTVLSRTSVPFAWGVGVARLCVAATLGLGVGVAVAGVLLTRPAPRPRPKSP